MAAARKPRERNSRTSISGRATCRLCHTNSPTRTNPATIGGVRVVQIDDFASGFGMFPPSDLLRYQLEGGGRVIVRPSGTEPKLKCYLDTWSTDGTAAERNAAANALLATLDAGMRELLS